MGDCQALINQMISARAPAILLMRTTKERQLIFIINHTPTHHDNKVNDVKIAITKSMILFQSRGSTINQSIIQCLSRMRVADTSDLSYLFIISDVMWSPMLI